MLSPDVFVTRVCITGSTDGIGLATARLLVRRGTEVVVHARSEERGRPVADELGAPLVVGDLASLRGVRDLAAQLLALRPLDVLVHNAGVWVRGDTPRTTVDGLETTFAVNVLAPHLLTGLLRTHVTGRVLWLGSGMAASGRPDAAALGQERDPRRAYAESKACDVLLAQAWGRRLALPSAAFDPGWVRTKLASAGAPGDVEQSADGLAHCCTDAPLATAVSWKGRRPAPVPAHLHDQVLQDAVAAACDRLAAG